MGSWNLSFHLVSAVSETLKASVLSQQFRLLGGAALSSPSKSRAATRTHFTTLSMLIASLVAHIPATNIPVLHGTSSMQKQDYTSSYQLLQQQATKVL